MALQYLKQFRGEVTLEELSGDTGISVSQLSRYESGKRDPSLTHLSALAKRFGVSIAQLIGQDNDEVGTLPVVGYVGAGAVHVPFETSEIERIPAPAWANDRTVAAVIRGDSLGSIFDTWLVYYDQVHEKPTSKLMGRLCVIGLADKRVLVKKLARGTLPGFYTLISNYEPPIYDVVVEWCAEVLHMSPR